ncbi:glycoside hydrolase family 15 protein [Microvirga pudoricolor]|uniref:glycoside hydrolase family 15 protein n=1 Tax=Microvirga pudoricolor TaxID=2778729 RepID=UPI00194FCF8D|nr:glycoside hydrolase family 15 protein [Microvirga pudoricolor]MBM6594072.1 glycoside hydrolase family 15 protein [Microvirga pudoricolor]
MTESDRDLPIEHYGVIGDMRSLALVGTNGSIDFLCWPHFDSPTVFGALLDRKKGGRFKISPALDDAHPRQLYLSDTNILLTRFLEEDGVAEISDFMWVRSDGSPGKKLVRRAKSVQGELGFRMTFDPRFGYARVGHKVEETSEGLVFVPDTDAQPILRLRSPDAKMQVQDGAAVAEFKLRGGASAAFVLEEVEPGQDSPAAAPDFVTSAFKETANYWTNWIGRSTYQGRWREMVHRSALVLKLLTSHKYGSMVAAPTFGLPETLGGTRNWDYRYTWIRDASFTVYAFIRLGFMDEARAYMAWIHERACEPCGQGPLQLMYAIDGHHELPEEELEHLSGYADSQPVRIGNAAYSQLQIDIYGELMDSVYLSNKYGIPISYEGWRNVQHMVDWLGDNWRRPDEGIWEFRGGRKEFLHSRVMSWVAVDRALRLADKRSLPAPMTDWATLRDDIFRSVHEEFWDEKERSFVQYKGGTSVDASALMMPLVRFISPTDPRWLSTLDAITRRLARDSLVHRYDASESTFDALEGTEGSFTMCSFWYVEALARSGDLRQARFLFEKMLGYANHVGLYAEELGPKGEHLGNYPQAFTHLSLISAAYYIDRELSNGHPRAWTI